MESCLVLMQMFDCMHSDMFEFPTDLSLLMEGAYNLIEEEVFLIFEHEGFESV